MDKPDLSSRRQAHVGIEEGYPF